MRKFWRATFCFRVFNAFHKGNSSRTASMGYSWTNFIVLSLENLSVHLSRHLSMPFSVRFVSLHFMDQIDGKGNGNWAFQRNQEELKWELYIQGQANFIKSNKKLNYYEARLKKQPKDQHVSLLSLLEVDIVNSNLILLAKSHGQVVLVEYFLIHLAQSILGYTCTLWYIGRIFRLCF